jgi:hypothetical protein
VFIPRHKSKRKFRFVYLRGPPFGRAIYSTRRCRHRGRHSLFHIYTLNLLHTYYRPHGMKVAAIKRNLLSLFLQQPALRSINNFACCGCKQKNSQQRRQNGSGGESYFAIISRQSGTLQKVR